MITLSILWLSRILKQMCTYLTSVLQAGWVENRQYWQLTILHGHDMVTCSCKVFLVSFTSQFLLVQETDLKRHDAKWSFREQEIRKKYLVIQKKKSSKLTFSACQKLCFAWFNELHKTCFWKKLELTERISLKLFVKLSQKVILKRRSILSFRFSYICLSVSV